MITDRHLAFFAVAFAIAHVVDRGSAQHRGGFGRRIAPPAPTAPPSRDCPGSRICQVHGPRESDGARYCDVHNRIHRPTAPE